MRQIDYHGYFWQYELVRLRALQDDDWEGHYYSRFDSSARRLLNYEVELPPTILEAWEFIKKFANLKCDIRRLIFTIENHNCGNVGGINLNSIDEKTVLLVLECKLIVNIVEKVMAQ